MAPWWSVKPTSLAEEDQPVEQLPDGEGDWLDKLWADDDLAPAVRTQPVDTDADTADTGADTAEDDDQEEVEERRKWLRREPGYWPEPRLPALPRPALSDKAKRGFYNAGAAGAGWYLGLGPTISGWIADCGRHYSISAALILGGGICLGIAVLWDSRTQHWYRPLRWLARIPLATAVTALALYAPASHV
jgi:hypothetical protein